MKKVIGLLIMSVFIISTTSAFQLSGVQTTVEGVQNTLNKSIQDNISNIDSTIDKTANDMLKNGAKVKKMIAKRKAEFKRLTSEKNKFVKSRILEQKANIDAYREANKGDMRKLLKDLDDDIKTQLKEIRKNNNELILELRKSLKEKGLSKENREEIRAEIEKIREEGYEEMKKVLGDNEGAIALLAERKDVFEANKELRGQISEKRKEFRAEKAEKISKYRNIFIERIGKVIDKISPKKATKLNEQITKMIKRVEDNSKMEEAKKDALLIKLEALRDMLIEKLDNTDDEDMLDIESLLGSTED